MQPPINLNDRVCIYQPVSESIKLKLSLFREEGLFLKTRVSGNGRHFMLVQFDLEDILIDDVECFLAFINGQPRSLKRKDVAKERGIASIGFSKVIHVDSGVNGNQPLRNNLISTSIIKERARNAIHLQCFIRCPTTKLNICFQTNCQGGVGLIGIDSASVAEEEVATSSSLVDSALQLLIANDFKKSFSGFSFVHINQDGVLSKYSTIPRNMSNLFQSVQFVICFILERHRRRFAVERNISSIKITHLISLQSLVVS